MTDQKKTSLRQRIEEGLRKGEDKDAILLKYVGDHLANPSPEVFREAIDWLLEMHGEVEELRFRADKLGFVTKDRPSHHIQCGAFHCFYQKDGKCGFVTFSGERLIIIDSSHSCNHFKKDPKRETKAEKKPEDPKGTVEKVGSWTMTVKKKNQQ